MKRPANKKVKVIGYLTFLVEWFSSGQLANAAMNKQLREHALSVLAEVSVEHPWLGRIEVLLHEA